MNTSRATLMLSAILLAAVFSLSTGHAPADGVSADPSVPPAGVALVKSAPAAEGNVQDMTY